MWQSEEARDLEGLCPAVEDAIAGRVAALPPGAAEGSNRGEELHGM